MQRHARDIRLDVGDFDMIVSLARALRARRNIGAAMLAGRSEQVALARGIGVQPPVRAGMRLARASAGGLLRGLPGGYWPWLGGVLDSSGGFGGVPSLA